MNTVKSRPHKNFFGEKITKRHISTICKTALGVLLMLLLGLGFRLPGLFAKDAAHRVSPAPRPLPVATVQVEALNAYQVSRTYTGQLEARRTSDLGFERMGKLVDLTVEEGTPVAAGQLLARLDTQALQATRRALLAERAQATARLDEMRAGPRLETIAAARARVHELQAEHRLAQRRKTRRQQLFTKGVIPKEELDTVEAGVKTWLARLDAAQRQLDELLAGTRREQMRAQRALLAQLDARLEALAVELDNSLLKAPFTGTVSARLVDEGTVVGVGQPILRLVENSHLEARVGLPPHTAVTLITGSTQRVQIGQTLYEAQVTALLPELDAATRTVTVVLTLDATGTPRVVPGQTVRLHRLETVESPGFWLPTTALTRGERGLWSCYALVTEPGTEPPIFRVERRDVEVLHTESTRVFARGLLRPGERVVKHGTHRLVAGQRVQPTL